ncbi:TPA: phage portal protein [Streptococcus equi subsp. zooepidemicus]|uniref:phage portal protein n=1 Tax=Streptococcus equi TaxID=1336 RepID=UPI001E28A121|nr:phage portal protein [Streptococcus equi]MCD3467279.1 phage portal protein [Streptococcus equi subsp. zooepidemicus]HEL0548239.1 phage portal protein [Streptococcus equi subsp. zooepidemicus]HEL0550252.1 phage portal protein [Streptococcus equi subsp. zooepidemicus]HEL1063095.1 phage portal protein [Streptococcus equi subsp. zooepidemicus]HEL1064539.1 phage portal protein [Streptococcus equi subsp. zooepidemicus]
MGLFTGLFRTRDAPSNRTSGSSYSFLMGSTTSGKRVNERTSMQMTAVYSCVRILSEAVASLPLNVYRYTDNGGKEKAIDHSLFHLLHDEPNPEMSSFIFRETLMTHLLLWGNAYAQIIRNGKGEVIALYPLMPDRMSVDRDKNGQLYYKYTKNNDDAPTMESGSVYLSPSDVLHIPGLGFDGLVGYSPIAMAKNAIGLAIAAEEYGSKFYANGAAPSGILEHPGTLKDPARVRDSWNATFGGSSNSNKVAVLEEGMKYTPISIAPNEAQFLETRKFQINEIARIFRVPPHMVGDLEKSSFSNIEQQSLEFVKYTLDPWVIRWEQALYRTLLTEEEKKTVFFKFNVEGLLRGDYASRMNGYATARQNGWMSANDIRELENLDRIPAELGGDLYLVNGNMLPLNSAGAAYANRISEEKEEPDEETEEVLGMEKSSRTRIGSGKGS